VFLPLLLIILAVLAGAVVAYGTHPAWAQFEHGLQLIMLSRRAQWPLVAVVLLLCLGLMGLVISGRRRAWWLIGLAPVLALFAHRFWSERQAAPLILESPAFVEAADADFIQDDDYVVAVSFGVNPQSYAYPYATLFRAPVIVQADHERRMMLLWSAHANRVLAFQIDRDVKVRDLEVISTPANSPLLFNSRLGQFVVAVTGMTPDGQQPHGFGKPVPATKMTWRQWRTGNPEGKVLAPHFDAPATPQMASAAIPGAGRTAESRKTAGVVAPTRPILPAHGMHGVPQPAPGAPRTRVALVGTTRPAAVDADAIGRSPVNLTRHADGEPVFVFRPDPASPPKAFARRVGNGEAQVWPRFEAKQDPRRPDVMFRDVDTGSSWTATGKWAGGNPRYKGTRLTPVPVDDSVDWTVMKFWYPDLELPSPDEKSAIAAPPASSPQGAPPTKPLRRTRQAH
jgi:hypothetical protein